MTIQVLLFRCNGVPDCKDRTDEPAGCLCLKGQFRCDNGRCIPEYNVCNLVDDCLYAWLFSQIKLFVRNQFFARDSSDEQNCSLACSTENDAFHCTHRHRCILSGQISDGIQNCADHPDEMHCSVNLDPAKRSCNLKTHFMCGLSAECVPRSSWCDGIADCKDRVSLFFPSNIFL